MTQAFNLSQLANKVNTSGQLDANNGLTGVVPVANGGTGQSSLTANALLTGNGTSGIGTIAVGSSGQALVSNGSAWVAGTVQSITPSSGSAPYYGARAWLNMKGANPCVIRASQNISSVAYNSQGLYTINLSSAMPDGNCVMAGMAYEVDGYSGDLAVMVAPSTVTGSAIAVRSYEISNSSDYNAYSYQVVFFR